jgi:hypothetical protein
MKVEVLDCPEAAQRGWAPASLDLLTQMTQPTIAVLHRCIPLSVNIHLPSVAGARIFPERYSAKCSSKVEPKIEDHGS